MGVAMHDLLGSLPQHLKDKAYLADKESAWPKDEALSVVEFCKGQGIAVLGGEVWLPTQSGPTIPTPVMYAWEADQKVSTESWSQFVGRTSETAKKYIAEFCWDPADASRALTPVFNLTMSDESEYDRITCGN